MFDIVARDGTVTKKMLQERILLGARGLAWFQSVGVRRWFWGWGAWTSSWTDLLILARLCHGVQACGIAAKPLRGSSSHGIASYRPPPVALAGNEASLRKVAGESQRLRAEITRAQGEASVDMTRIEEAKPRHAKAKK